MSNENNSNSNNLSGMMMGVVTMSLIQEKFDELEVARECIEDILEKLPLFYQGTAIELEVPQRGEELENINKGLEAIRQGCPIHKVQEYFREGLRSIENDRRNILIFGPRLVHDMQYSFANMKDGIIPTPACLSEFF